MSHLNVFQPVRIHLVVTKTNNSKTAKYCNLPNNADPDLILQRVQVYRNWRVIPNSKEINERH